MENRDRIVKILAYEGRIHIIAGITTSLVEKARKIHDLSPIATAAFGRALTVTALMAVNMKNDNDKLTIQIKGNGPLGSIVITSTKFPKLKGYVQNKIVDLPLKNGKLDIGGAVGKQGYLNVIKDIGLKEPYIGMVPLVSGEIAEDFASYFVTSEQTNTAVNLGVLVDSKGVKQSGGYIVTPMPDATEDDLFILENRIREQEPISKMLEKHMTLLEIAKDLTGDEKAQIIEQDIMPLYECDCSKEKIEKGLISLGKKELQDIIQTEIKIETVCHFCNQKYSFTKEELQKLVGNMK